MTEQTLKHLFDALEAARHIVAFSAKKTYEDFCADELLSSAIERKFEIIGEALTRVRNKKPEDLEIISEWTAIIGFRNILAHGYDHVDEAVVWGIVENQIPPLILELERIEGIEG
ncbi:MAG: HepT-like ribonuclease domain-containing protein [Verrucomicrobiota bacterium]